jgi:HK97 family phage major capsid protein
VTIDLSTLRGIDAHRVAREDLKAHLLEIEQEANGTAFSDPQRADFAQTVTSLEEIDAVIAELDVRAEKIKSLAETAEVKATEAPFRAPNIAKSVDNLYDLAAYRQRVSSIDELPRALRDGAMRVIEKADFPTATDPDKARARVAQLLAKHKDDEGGKVAERIIATDNPVYREAMAAYLHGGEKSMSPRHQAVLQTGSDSDGGFAIPFAIDPTFIITTDGAASSLREFARIETITGKSWHPLTTEDGAASYAGETDEADDTAPSDIDDVNGVTPVRAQRFIKFTAEYQEDYGSAAILSQVGALIQDSKELLEAEKFVQGTGSGEPEGIIWKLDDDASSLVSVASFDLDALDAVTAALGPRFRRNAAFMANLSILQKVRQLGDAGHPANSIYDPLSKTLYGYQARELSFMDDAWTSGKEVLLFGDFKQFVIVDRLGLSVEYVPQVFNGDGKPLGQRGVYARWRNTSKVIVPNAFRLLTHS